MALRRLIGRLGVTEVSAIRGVAERVRQTVLIEADVLRYVSRYRQLRKGSTEAGGQIFGAINDENVIVVRASGPYRGDERSRFRYRSNSIAAQKEVEREAKAGRLYLGEWHTHAEDMPRPSQSDVDTMRKLIAHSSLNVDALFMLIVGRGVAPGGLNLLSVSARGLDKWRLMSIDPHGSATE